MGGVVVLNMLKAFRRVWSQWREIRSLEAQHTPAALRSQRSLDETKVAEINARTARDAQQIETETLEFVRDHLAKVKLIKNTMDKQEQEIAKAFSENLEKTTEEIEAKIEAEPELVWTRSKHKKSSGRREL